MFRTFINIRDGEYYLPTFTAATSSPYPFLFPQEASSLPSFVPIPGTSDSARLYIGHVII